MVSSVPHARSKCSRRGTPTALQFAACLIVALVGAARGRAQEPPAPQGAPAPSAPSSDVAWIGTAPPTAEALAADPAAFDALLADNGLALDVAGHSVSARGGTLHDKTTLAYPIEYVLVTERGRTHEALFVIKAQPSLLDACLRAAGLKPGTPMRFRPRVPVPTEAEMDAGASPWDPVPSSGPLVDIAVAWTDDAGAPHRRSLESMLLDVRDGKPLPERDWVYTGSRLGSMRQGKKVVQTFLADLEGDIVALYLTGEGDCLLERNSLDGLDDTLYTLNAEGMPPRGTPVTVTFTATGKSVVPAPPPADATVVKGELGKKLDDYLTRLVPWGFAGVVLVDKGGEMVLHKGYGLADRAAGIPVTTATVYALGKLSHVFVATAILQLEASSKLKRDDRIARYLQDVPEDKAGITVRQLLDNTSGQSATGAGATVDRATALAEILAAPLTASPGTHAFGEEDPDDALLIAIVEDVSGESWRSYLAEHIFGPAGMVQSGLSGDARWDRTQIAHGYGERGRPDAGEDLGTPSLAPPTWLGLARGVVMPVGDFYRWQEAVVAGRLVSDEFQGELLAQREMGVVPRDATKDVADSAPTFGFETPSGSGCALGYARGIDPPLTVIVAESHWPGTAFNQVVNAARGGEIPPGPGVPSAYPEELAACAGDYAAPGQDPIRHADTLVVVSAVSEGLLLRSAGQKAQAALAEALGLPAEHRPLLDCPDGLLLLRVAPRLYEFEDKAEQHALRAQFGSTDGEAASSVATCRISVDGREILSLSR